MENKKVYIVDWASSGNIAGDKKKVIFANDIADCQDQFLDWLKLQPVYKHMWKLVFNIEEAC
jgi:hypothetical protein